MTAAAALLCLTFPHPRPPSLALALALLPVLRPTRLQLRTFTRIFTHTFTHTSHPLTPHHAYHTAHPHHTPARHPRHTTHTTPRHATPRHPQHTTPRQVDELLEVAWTCRRWLAAVQGDCLWACTRFSACDGRTPPELPTSPYISLYLPTSPYISLHLPISPCISCAPGALLRHFRMHGRTVDDHTGRWGRCSRTIDVAAARC